MLKIVGLTNGKVEDEKILLTEDNKLTTLGIVALGIVALALVTVLGTVYKVVKWIKR